ncbi:MAG: methyltransferase, TIGR04325 family [Hyphomicrobiales bacterium]|nr:MAG: methyltransferase, TIGR04325 family [Hyphomicrobiales bacterium]
MYAASRHDGRLNVLDFGGAFGSAYWQNRRFLEHLPELRWSVVEQRAFVEAGIKEFQRDHLRFYYDVSECLANEQVNLLLLSGVLHYLPAPYDFLQSTLERRIPYVLIDRAMAHRLGRDRLSIQKVPAWIYDASYPVWLMDADRMENLFERMDYEVIDRFEPHPGTMCGPEDFSAPYVGWFLRLRTRT